MPLYRNITGANIKANTESCLEGYNMILKDKCFILVLTFGNKTIIYR